MKNLITNTSKTLFASALILLGLIVKEASADKFFQLNTSEYNRLTQELREKGINGTPFIAHYPAGNAEEQDRWELGVLVENDEPQQKMRVNKDITGANSALPGLRVQRKDNKTQYRKNRDTASIATGIGALGLFGYGFTKLAHYSFNALTAFLPDLRKKERYEYGIYIGTLAAVATVVASFASAYFMERYYGKLSGYQSKKELINSDIRKQHDTIDIEMNKINQQVQAPTVPMLDAQRECIRSQISTRSGAETPIRIVHRVPSLSKNFLASASSPSSPIRIDPSGQNPDDSHLMVPTKNTEGSKVVSRSLDNLSERVFYLGGNFIDHAPTNAIRYFKMR